MEIKATCRYDLASIRALTHLVLFRRKKPARALILRTVFFAVLEAVIIWAMSVFGPEREIILMAVILIVWYLLILCLYFLAPKTRYNAMANLKDAENEYVFGDEAVTVISKSASYNGEARLEYPLFVKAYETSDYLFLYQTKNQAYIVDKSTITGGTVEELREKLTLYLKKKYIRCRY